MQRYIARSASGSLKQTISPYQARNVRLAQRRLASSAQVTSQTQSQASKPPTALNTVARATATGSYFIVVSAGVALLGIVFWALGSNLFFETRYFSEAVDMIKDNADIKRLVECQWLTATS